MAYYRCGPTAIGSRASWSVTSPTVEPKSFDRPLSGNYDRIFNAFERTNAFEYVRSTFEGKQEERHVGHGDIVVNRKMSSSFERADCALAAQTPCSDEEDFYREKILYSQARQLFPLQEDLADWINKTIGITYLTGENFLDALDNGAELCQLAAVIHERARESLDQGLIVGPVPAIRGRCWQRAARRSFFSRDNAENFITFCRELGVHENLLFESDDLVLHNQPRQVILCLLEVARLATRFAVEPPGLVQLEKEIALEERDSGLDSAMSGAWQFRDTSPVPNDKSAIEEPPYSPDSNETEECVPDNVDAESTKSGGTENSSDNEVPLRPTNELDKRVQLVTRLMQRGCNCGAGRCSKSLKVKKVGEGRYNIAGRNVFIRLLKGRHMMVRVGGGWDTLEHFLSRHEPCQVRLVAPGVRAAPRPAPPPPRARQLSASSSRSSLRDPSPHSPPSPSTPPRTSPAPRTPPASPATRAASSGTASPASSKSSLGKISPVDPKMGASPAKTSPPEARRTSTPGRPRPAMTLPLGGADRTPRRRQPAPASHSTPNTPTARAARTPPLELRKSLTSAHLNAPKKSRSMSLALAQDDRRPFCGTDRLNQAKKNRGPTAPNSDAGVGRKNRSQSLASTPVNEPKRPFASAGPVKKTRSMSLATAYDVSKPLIKSSSVGGVITQAAIEESIRLSLEASIADETAKKPFLHIKAKYRSPPPREVPPR
ncbi:GAS2-like protein 3 [Aricia agestis]|uniref:GAS2-like protein 3 n=1 Tax=Aricia agestis TaxID=91739 RepID=UPI001C20B92C|nr:GAS2-like protein 3 [Aricia agestis]XP_041968939.1 GAS2-like protein 3 [Aricia agestis]XP_041968940.1 GAS2-like protein 3 [Aricia agestis]